MASRSVSRRPPAQPRPRPGPRGRVASDRAVQLRQADKGDQGLLTGLWDAMMDASICGLGQAAPNPILLTMKYFGDEV